MSARPASRPASGAPTAPAIFDRLRADHRRVLRELEGLERTVAAIRRRGATTSAELARTRTLAEHLARQFGTHMAAEDEVLFPRLAAILPGGATFVGPLHAEHGELRELLADLRATLARRAAAARDERLAVQSRDLIDLLRIHIRKEEALVFSVAERVLAPEELRALAARRDAEAQGAPRPAARPRRRKGEPS